MMSISLQMELQKEGKKKGAGMWIFSSPFYADLYAKDRLQWEEFFYTFFADYSKKGYVYLTYSSILFTTYSVSAGMNKLVLTSLVSRQQNENKKLRFTRHI